MLDGKTAVVTGGGRNIGRGIAETFADRGAEVVVLDVDETAADAVVAELPASGGREHATVRTDVTDPAEVQAAAEAIAEAYPSVDVLVNNVAHMAGKGVFDLELPEWQAVIDRSLTSTFLCTKHVGRHIAETGGGSIINLGSGLGHRGKAGMLAYCTAKGGIINMTRALAEELVAHDIRVNSLSPGPTGTPVGRETGGYGIDPASMPLGRIGTPEDVGNAAAFLASELAAFITGIDLEIRGGFSGVTPS